MYGLYSSMSITNAWPLKHGFFFSTLMLDIKLRRTAKPRAILSYGVYVSIGTICIGRPVAKWSKHDVCFKIGEFDSLPGASLFILLLYSFFIQYLMGNCTTGSDQSKPNHPIVLAF